MIMVLSRLVFYLTSYKMNLIYIYIYKYFSELFNTNNITFIKENVKKKSTSGIRIKSDTIENKIKRSMSRSERIKGFSKKIVGKHLKPLQCRKLEK